MEKAIVFNIQRYSIHDGGGIRTIVFLKGCPLRCLWCSNPESQSREPEILIKESLCNHCSASDPFSCTKSPDFCPTGALEVIGKEMTIEGIVKEVQKDLIFYETSGGGVTLSGGEPLYQGRIAVDLLKRLKILGIDTAIETTGFVKWNILDQASDYLDRVLFDLKIMNKEKSLEIVKADVSIIKKNFTKLVEKGVEIIPRVPLIPGYTMDEKNIESIIEFVTLHGFRQIHILPFHQYGSSKYKGLGREYDLKNISPPSDQEVQVIKDKMSNAGLYVNVGGN